MDCLVIGLGWMLNGEVLVLGVVELYYYYDEDDNKGFFLWIWLFWCVCLECGFVN